jgi:hypothetical protein
VRTSPLYGRECDLIEAGLNEAAATALSDEKSSRPVVCDNRQTRTRAQLGRYGADVAIWGEVDFSLYVISKG